MVGALKHGSYLYRIQKLLLLRSRPQSCKDHHHSKFLRAGARKWHKSVSSWHCRVGSQISQQGKLKKKGLLWVQCMALRQKASRNANLSQAAGPRQALEHPCLENGSEVPWKISNPKLSDRFSQGSNSLVRNMQVNRQHWSKVLKSLHTRYVLNSRDLLKMEVVL